MRELYLTHQKQTFCFDNQAFEDFRQYKEPEWRAFRDALLEIVKWSAKDDGVQFADLEDITQDILLAIQKVLQRPDRRLVTETAPLKKYAFKAARNRLNNRFKRSKWTQKFRLLSEDFDVPVPPVLNDSLALVGEVFALLGQKDRDCLEEEIFGYKSTLEVAAGSKRKANGLYKKNFDARARFRAALLRARRQEKAVIRHLDAKFANLKGVA